MGEKFNEFSVINFAGDKCYCVRDRNTNQLYLLEAVFGFYSLSSKKKETVLSQLEELINTDVSKLVRCIKWIEHPSSNILYVVKEYFPDNLEGMINRCKTSKTYLDELYIWKIICDVSSTAWMLKKRRFLVQLNLSSNFIYLDAAKNIKLGYKIVPNFKSLQIDKVTHQTLGALVYKLCTLQEYQCENKDLKLPSHYSEDFQQFLKALLTATPSLEDIIHHPALVTQMTNTMEHLTIVDDHKLIGSANTECQRCKILENKLSKLKSKTVAILAKESQLKQREIEIFRKEKKLDLLEKKNTERIFKMERARKFLNKNALDSTLSGEEGDLTPPKTISRLDPSRVLKPNFSMADKRRTVHFEPEIGKNTKIWLKNKKAQFLESNKENLHVLRGPPSGASDCGFQEITHQTRDKKGLIETFL